MRVAVYTRASTDESHQPYFLEAQSRAAAGLPNPPARPLGARPGADPGRSRRRLPRCQRAQPGALVTTVFDLYTRRRKSAKAVANWLNDRGAHISKRASNSSDYLLGGLIACTACLPEAQCGERVRTLGAKIAEVRDRRTDLIEAIEGAELQPQPNNRSPTTRPHVLAPSPTAPTTNARPCYKCSSTKCASRAATASSPLPECRTPVERTRFAPLSVRWARQVLNL